MSTKHDRGPGSRPDPGVRPADLLGRWRLSRTIDDSVAPEQISVTGTAELIRDRDGRIRWSETGRMHRGGEDTPVRRTLYVDDREDGVPVVLFEDGRVFHPWRTDTLLEHDCPPDRYVGELSVIDSNRWQVRWQVIGPGKSYRMVTGYTRLD